jgi:hypothetical protein
MIAENKIADRRNPGMSHRLNRRRRRVRRNGYALVIVTMLILTMSGMAAVHQRNLNAALRVEQARMESEAYRLGPLTVLAHAIDLLKTGDAPAPVSYSYAHTVGSITTLYRVSYAVSGAGDNTWNVTVDPDPSAEALSTLPEDF